MNGMRTAGELYLSKKDLVELILERFVILRDGEFVLGKMEDNGDHVLIPFAINSECHPTQEVTKEDTPQWLAQLQKENR